MKWSFHPWTHYSYDPPTQDQASKTSQYSTASSTNLTEVGNRTKRDHKKGVLAVLSMWACGKEKGFLGVEYKLGYICSRCIIYMYQTIKE